MSYQVAHLRSIGYKSNLYLDLKSGHFQQYFGRLGDDEAVKGIAMMKGKGFEDIEMGRTNRKEIHQNLQEVRQNHLTF